MLDPTYLQTEQYAGPANLEARIALHARFSTNPQGWTRWMWEQVDWPPAPRILELGTGPGSLWEANADRVPPDAHIVLSDFSPGMIAAARAALASDPAPFRYLVADAQALPCAPGQFDVVIANHMLYHVPDRARALAEVRRVLRPGGRFYAATLGDDHMQELHDLMARHALPGAFSSALAFSLENGPAQLAPAFPRFTLRRYTDSLRVTEAAPLLAYIRSMTRRPALDTPAWAALSTEITATLARDHVLPIRKASGLFICEV